MFSVKIAVVFALLHLATAFDSDAVRPWMEKNKGDKVSKVPEDTIIVDLRSTKYVNFTCPIVSKNKEKDEELYATWYIKRKDTDKEREIMYTQGRYDFPTFVGLLVENLRPEDEAVYICKRGLTPEIVKIFRLLILDMLETTKSPAFVEPPVWSMIPEKYIVANSRNLVLAQCTTTKPNTKISVYQLKHDGTIFKQFRQPAVVIHRPKVDDTGDYMCVAENSAGKIEYRFEIVVKVNGGWGNWKAWGPCDKECGFGYKTRQRDCNNPSPAGGGRQCDGDNFERAKCQARSCQRPFLKKFGFEIADDALILSCRAAGIPTPTIQWYLNGAKFPPNYDSQNTEFRIPRNQAQSGSYSCNIRNNIGFVTMYINIKL